MTEEAATEKRKYDHLKDLPGIGPATAQKLRELGFHTIESLDRILSHCHSTRARAGWNRRKESNGNHPLGTIIYLSFFHQS